MKEILMLYCSLLTPIIAGIINSIFCKSNTLNKLKKPIDNNIKLKGKRLFGDNKTWKGFLGYIFFNVIISIILGILSNKINLNNMNFFYINNENTIKLNILIGFLLGLSYALFELPNSFIKRRLDIEPGKNPTGIKRIFFIFLDQADSVFGILLVVCMFYKLSILKYLLYVVIGALTHIIINILLYLCKLRKNMF